MSDVLLVTCNSDSTTPHLRSAGSDAINLLRLFGHCAAVRERHLFPGALPPFSENVIVALKTEPCRRSAVHWKSVALTDLLLGEVDKADIVVIVAPIYNGAPTVELSQWMEYVGQAGQCVRDFRLSRERTSQGKVVIVIAEQTGTLGGIDAANSLALFRDALRERLSSAGVTDVAVFDIDKTKFSLSEIPLLLVFSQSTFG